MFKTLFIFLSLLVFPLSNLNAERLVNFEGEIIENEDLSAICGFGDGLIAIGSDEGNEIQLLKADTAGDYETIGEPIALTDDDDEIDIEGLACRNEYIYVVASHSLKRKRVKAKKSYKKNRKRLEEDFKFDPNRKFVFRVKINPHNEKIVTSVEETDLLYRLIEEHPVLSRYRGLPSKENGIDIEGLAMDDAGEMLTIGFRGPVLRDGYSPVLSINADTLFSEGSLEETDYSLNFVKLNGLGIRSMAKVKNGFLLIAGPVNDLPGPYKIYFWNGEDMIPGDGAPEAVLEELYTIEVPEADDGVSAKAEGLLVTSEDDDAYDVVLIFDGIENGAPEAVRVEKL